MTRQLFLESCKSGAGTRVIASAGITMRLATSSAGTFAVPTVGVRFLPKRSVLGRLGSRQK